MLVQSLVLFVTVAGSLAFDFCHTDPRLQVLQNDPSSTASCPSAIYVPELGRNPNHALHDRLWAVSHYLKHCADNEASLILNDHVFYNLSLCGEEDESPDPKRPTWGICVAFILSQWHKLLLYFSKSHIWPEKMAQTPGSCYSRHIWIGVQPTPAETNDLGITVSHFRKLSWFGRDCEQQKPCLSGMGPLPESLQRSALGNIASAAYNFLEIEFAPQESVNILVYDRSDTIRRQWNGASEVFDKLRSDKRVNVQLLHRMPISFARQVKLFTWANIVVAPHGGAMANTIFMQTGSDILEVRRNCEADKRFPNFMPWDWTGWHAHLLGLNLMYIRCTMQKEKTKRTSSLKDEEPSQFTVNVTEVLRVLEGCIRRQIHRRNAAHRNQLLNKKLPGEEDEEIFDLVHREFQRITIVEFSVLVSIAAMVIIGSRFFSRRSHRMRRT